MINSYLGSRILSSTNNKLLTTTKSFQQTREPRQHDRADVCNKTAIRASANLASSSFKQGKGRCWLPTAPLKLLHNRNNDNQPTKVYVISHLSIRRRCARWSVLEASRLENLHINTDLKIYIRIKSIAFPHEKVVSRKQNFRKFRGNYMYRMRISNSNSTHSCSECFGWTMEESGPLTYSYIFKWQGPCPMPLSLVMHASTTVAR